MESPEVKTQVNAIERFGWVTKEEPLSCITDTNLQLDICILEAVSPFYGYYDDQPKTNKPQYLYWILERHYSYERISRAFDHLRNNCNARLDCAYGTVTIIKEKHPVIRMLNLGQYNQITTVQKLFEEVGVFPKRGSRKLYNQMGLIQLSKIFQFNVIEEGLFLDPKNSHRGFFTIPKNIVWDDFKTITTEVKYDTSLIFFDAARAAYMEDGRIHELVRIYRENLTIEKLKAIRDRYLKLIERY